MWCVNDGELAALMEASRTRLDRVADAEFNHHFDREVARLVEPGLHRSLTFKMLVDDLAATPDQSAALLACKLADTNGEVRCVAADLALKLGGGFPAVRLLLDDAEAYVRWHVIFLLAGYGDDSAVEPLIAKLKSDPDAGVRVQAAFALGHIGSLAVIPHLIHAIDHDHECDCHGHSPSSVSATALDNILGTNQTRIMHDGGFCSMPPWPPDIDALKSQASELYRKWMADYNET